jgi:hypothetical protein
LRLKAAVARSDSCAGQVAAVCAYRTLTLIYKGPSVLDVVALLTDLPAHGLARGQVGTIVERLDDDTLLVEFSDDEGRAYGIAPYPRAELLVLHYVPEVA